MDAARRRELQEAMTRLAEGDRAAFVRVFETTWPVVRDFARSMLRGSADAEDAAQQALLKLFERAAEFDPDREALAWVLGIAWNECRTLRRRAGRRREESLEPLAEATAGGPSPEEEAVGADLERAASEALGSLSPGDVETILADIEGRRPAIPAATFRKRLERARRRLRQAWSARYGG